MSPRLCDTWDSQQWLRDYKENYRLARQVVFQSTVEAASSHYYLLNGQRIDISPAENLVTGTKMYHNEFFPEPKRKYPDAPIEVLTKDCLVVAQELMGQGKIAVLNLANRNTPGGGVYGGAGAQEESLFRRSNYFLSLYQYAAFCPLYDIPGHPRDAYPMDRNFGACYSPNVTVFRDTEDKGYPFLQEPWQCNFIAVAGINSPTTSFRDGQEWLTEEMERGTRNKIHTLFNVALDNDIEVLVLGALGCGAFRNPPQHVALLFKEILEEERYKNSFKKVVFAIKPNPYNDQSLPEVFEAVLRSKRK